MTAKGTNEEGWTRLDSWVMGADIMHCNDQEVTVSEKGKCCAFGDSIVGAGRAEWDLRIDFESFGGICFGLYRHNLRNKNNLSELPTTQHFAYTPNGYGYTNKTGALTHNSERKKYGQRFRHGDIVTIKLDLTARDLTFLVNGESQGLAYDRLPIGVYRLASKMQFKEQKVTILRFWTSLTEDMPSTPTSTSTPPSTTTEDCEPSQTSNIKTPTNDDVENDDSTTETVEDAPTIPEASFSQPKVDEDSDWFSSYNKEGNAEEEELDINDEEDIPEEEDRNRTLSEQLDKLQQMDENDINAEDETKTNGTPASDFSLIAGRSRQISLVESTPPETISMTSVDVEATDFFSKSGSNLFTQIECVTCTRQTNDSIHSAFGTHIVTRGKMIWRIKIEKGHSMQIGVCGLTDAGNQLFTNTQYGFGYGDDGNIYFDGAHIEYHAGYKQGDIVTVILDMDKKTLRFAVNDIDHGDAFDCLTVNEDVQGYGLAVSLKHRPHKVILLESTLYNTQRLSPRPKPMSFSGSNPHRRGISWTTLESGGIRKKIGKRRSTDSSDSKEKGTSIASNDDSIEVLVTDEPEVKVEDVSGLKAKGGKKKKNGRSKKKKKADFGILLISTNNSNDGSINKSRSRPRTPTPKKSKQIAWVKRESVKRDGWEVAGKKLRVDKSTVSSKPDIKDSQSAIGKLVITKNTKAKWDLSIKQGEKIGIGVIHMIGGLKSAKNRKILNACFGNNINGYGYMGNDGGIMRSGRYKKYGEKFKAGDKMSIILDMRSKTLSFVKNGEDQGIAFKNMPLGDYRLAVTMPCKWHQITLSKVSVWDC